MVSLGFAPQILVSAATSAQTRLNVAAQNIANQDSVGPTSTGPTTLPNGQAAPASYRPLVAQSAAISLQMGGGVVTSVSEQANGTFKSYEPQSGLADQSGYVERPNVDLTQQMVDMTLSKTDFQAALAAYKVSDDMTQTLLKMKSS